MKNITPSLKFWGYVFIISIFLIVNPYILKAQNIEDEYQGHYAKELKNKINKNNSKILKNLKSYSKDKSIVHLDESYNLIIQSTDAIYISLKTTFQQVLEIPKDDKDKKLIAQIDKLEVINIRDNELSYLCNRLYELGQLYASVDKNKAEQCFRDIVLIFTSYESESCNSKAKSALENYKWIFKHDDSEDLPPGAYQDPFK